MTIRELADVAGCGHTTVYRAARLLYPEKLHSGRRTEFDERESVRIMAEVRKKGLITAFQNEKVPSQNEKLEKLHAILNGPALRELVRIYGTREAARRIDHLIGYSRQADPDGRRMLPVPESDASNHFKRVYDRLQTIDAQKKQQDLFTLN